MKQNGTISFAYRDLAIAFFIMFAIITLIREIFLEIFGSEYLSYLGVLFAPCMMIVFVLAVRVIIKLKANKPLVTGILAILLTGIICRILSMFIVENADIKFSLSLLSSILITLVLVIIVYKLSVNLFSVNNHIVEKLWASVCVFFVLGAIFGSIYSMFLIIDPKSLGVTIIHPIEIYIYGMIYSINILSGLDPIFQGAGESFQMTAILESTMSTLFLVILIGRLLGGTGYEPK